MVTLQLISIHVLSARCMKGLDLLYCHSLSTHSKYQKSDASVNVINVSIDNAFYQNILHI